MDAISMARELGKAIQADERYIKMTLAQQQSDEDTELQAKITDFTEIRNKLNDELGKTEKNEDHIQQLNTEVREKYAAIFQNEHMAQFATARGEVEQMIAFINQIITGSVQGLDPTTIEYQESCGGDCGGCSGCN